MTAEIETASGKQAGDENFPVGSWILPRKLRPHIAVFYDYARAIDDIADNPELASDDKISRLDGFAAALHAPRTVDDGYAKAHAIRESLKATGVDRQHCIDLIAAFKQDAVKNRYRDWDDLMAYCLLSAAPVGRYLIDLHNEPEEAYAPSDALCNALQVLNHLQDCADDYRALDRVYLPQDWMAACEIETDALRESRSSPGLRAVLDLCLDETDRLLEAARGLPGGLGNFRFAVEAAVIIRIAGKLSRELRRRDPLAERVVLRRWHYVICGIAGFWDAVRR